MTHTLKRAFRDADGAEIAEAALVLPLVFMFLLGIVWFGRAFNIYSTITQAAQRGAITAARPTCATCSQGCAWVSGGNNTNFPCNTTVDNAVLSVMNASSLDPSRIATYTPASPPVPCPSPPSPPVPAGGCTSSSTQITICRAMWLNNPATPAQCGVIVAFQYPFEFYLPFTSLSLQQINLTAEAQNRMEN